MACVSLSVRAFYSIQTNTAAEINVLVLQTICAAFPSNGSYEKQETTLTGEKSC
jgi:hypothetical protein